VSETFRSPARLLKRSSRSQHHLLVNTFRWTAGRRTACTQKICAGGRSPTVRSNSPVEPIWVRGLTKRSEFDGGNIIRRRQSGHGFSRIRTDQPKGRTIRVDPWQTSGRRILRRLDQLHFAVASAVQHHHFALGITENENIAIAEMNFLDGFFQRHGAHSDRVFGAREVDLG
jgi:hypothetical protein